MPSPLSERPPGYRAPWNKLGLGGEDIDIGSDDEYALMSKTSYCISVYEEEVSNSEEPSYEDAQENSSELPQEEGPILDKEEESNYPIQEQEEEEGYGAAPLSLEDGGQPTVDELEEVNLGTENHPRPTFIAKALPEEEKSVFIDLLKEFREIFAWTYSEMQGLDPNKAMHHLHIDPGKKPVKQAPRNFRPELEQQIIKEINQLLLSRLKSRCLPLA